jgi:anti-sigma regulatory factor (Ser/Thr protein kinase)
VKPAWTGNAQSVTSFRSSVAAAASLRERLRERRREHEPAEAPSERLHLVLPRSATAPGAARRAVRVWCSTLKLDAKRIETVALLVSELVSNAVRHSPAAWDTPIGFAASLVDGTVLVAVTDAGAGFTPRPRDPKRLFSGYGLQIVASEARSWGVDTVGGTRVWFEL